MQGSEGLCVFCVWVCVCLLTCKQGDGISSNPPERRGDELLPPGAVRLLNYKGGEIKEDHQKWMAVILNWIKTFTSAPCAGSWRALAKKSEENPVWKSLTQPYFHARFRGKIWKEIEEPINSDAMSGGNRSRNLKCGLMCGSRANCKCKTDLQHFLCWLFHESLTSVLMIMCCFTLHNYEM